MLARRVAVLAEVKEPGRERVIGSGFVLAALSAVWTVEDNGDGWQGAMRVAKGLRKLVLK